VLRRWVRTGETYYRQASRTVCYLSAEFLLGPHLANNLLNIGVEAETRRALSELGYDLDRILGSRSATGTGSASTSPSTAPPGPAA
jgi:glycogen phosphorylase